jgi:hypothetical protein
MTTGTVAQETIRSVTAGRLSDDKSGFLIQLDGKEDVFTSDEAIASVAANAKKSGRGVIVDLEARPGNPVPVVIELRLAPAKQELMKAEPGAKPAAGTQTVMKTPAIPTGLIEDPLKLTEQLDALSRHYNVISPMIAVSEFAPGYGVNLVVVKIDSTITDEATGRGVDTYFSKKVHKANERALNKSGLMKISQALGIQWTAPKRLDDGSQANYWHWQYFGFIRTYDGQMQPVTGSRELDLRTGSAEASGMSEGQLKVARTFGNEICETKAMQRAIRNLVGQSYTVEQLAKPFLIPRFSFKPDTSDPAIKLEMTRMAMGGASQLYAPAEAPAMPAATTAAPALAAPVKSNPFDDAPAVAGSTANVGGSTVTTNTNTPIGGRKVKDVAVRTGTNARGPWTLAIVTFDDDTKASTFKAEHRAIAEAAMSKGSWVKATIESSDSHPDRNDLKAIEHLDGTQPDLPITGDAKDAGY